MTTREAIKHLKVEFLGEYEEIRKAKDVAIEAFEKQIPKKPLRGRCGTICPSCHRKEYIARRDALDIYCGFCGQAIDWSEN